MSAASISRRCAVGLLLLLVIAAGCNREKLPRLGRVSGTVTLDGQALSDATIVFEPTTSGIPATISRTDASGNYELYYSRGHKGTPPGEYQVRITTYAETAEEASVSIRKETVPAKYNVKTELKAEVKRGTNKHDFALQSGGEILQPDQAVPGKRKGRR
jgi:hypothetical protein